MNRAKLLFQLAVKQHILDNDQAENAYINYEKNKSEPGFPDKSLDQWVKQTSILTMEQFKKLLALSLTAELFCQNCGNQIEITEMTDADNWICPYCNSMDIQLDKLPSVSSKTEPTERIKEKKLSISDVSHKKPDFESENVSVTTDFPEHELGFDNDQTESGSGSTQIPPTLEVPSSDLDIFESTDITSDFPVEEIGFVKQKDKEQSKPSKRLAPKVPSSKKSRTSETTQSPKTQAEPVYNVPAEDKTTKETTETIDTIYDDIDILEDQDEAIKTVVEHKQIPQTLADKTYSEIMSHKTQTEDVFKDIDIEGTFADEKILDEDSFEISPDDFVEPDIELTETLENDQDLVVIPEDDKILLPQEELTQDSEVKEKVATEEISELKTKAETVPPDAEQKTFLHAKPSSKYNSVSDQDQLNSNGEFVHKGITPESLEKGLQEGAILDGFEIRGILGRGGMGIVYKGFDLALQRKVAIKVLSPNILQNETQIKRFEIEAQACASLEHHNVVNIYRFGTIYNHPYIVMQFISGSAISDIIKKKNTIPATQVVDYLLQAAEGLKIAHQKNIIHRDIKPDNLLVDNLGTVKIVDFGLAKQTKSDLNLSQSGYFLGTPAYIAPEQASGDLVDLRADIYSLGITAYQMLTGELPFRGSAAQVVTAHLIQELPTLTNMIEDCPVSLEQTIVKMAAKSPDNRYQDMDELIEALEYVNKEIRGEVVIKRKKSKKPVLAFALILLAIVSAGLVIAYLEMNKNNNGQPITDDFPTADNPNGTTKNPQDSVDNNPVETPEEKAARLEKERKEQEEKDRIAQAKKDANKIISSIYDGTISTEKETLDITPEILETLRMQFGKLISELEDSESGLLKNQFRSAEQTLKNRWKEKEEELKEQERLRIEKEFNELMIELEKTKEDTQSTSAMIEKGLENIDEFVSENSGYFSKFNDIKDSLKSIKTFLDEVNELDKKSADVDKPSFIIAYLESLWTIIENAKEYKFDKRETVINLKSQLVAKFNEWVTIQDVLISAMMDEEELEKLQVLIENFTNLKILEVEEKASFDEIQKKIANQILIVTGEKTFNKLKFELIDSIKEALIDKEILILKAKLKEAQDFVIKNVVKHPGIEEEIGEYISKIENLISELESAIGNIEKLQNECDDLIEKCKNLSRPEDAENFRNDIEEFINANPKFLDSEPVRQNQLDQAYRNCLVFLEQYDLIKPFDKNGFSWQYENIQQLGKFNHKINLSLNKVISKGTWRQPVKINVMALSPDRQFLVTGSQDGTVRVWDYKMQEEIRILENNAPVTAIACKLDNGNKLMIYTGLRNGNIVIWDATQKISERFDNVHKNEITQIQIGKFGMISSSIDKTTVQWKYKLPVIDRTDAKNKIPGEIVIISQYQKHPASVNQVKVDVKEEFYATACSDQKIRIFSLKESSYQKIIEGFYNSVNTVDFEPINGKLIAAAGDENDIKLINIKTGKIEFLLKGHKHNVSKVKFSANGMLFSSSFDGTVIRWNLATKNPDIVFKADNPVTDFVFDNTFLIIADWQGKFKKYLLSTGNVVQDENNDHKDKIIGCGINANGEIISASWDGRLLIWDKTGSEIVTKITLEKPENPDDAGSYKTKLENSDEHLIQMDLPEESNKTPEEIKKSDFPITCLEIDPTGKFAIVSDSTKGIFLTNLISRKVVKYWNFDKMVTSAAISDYKNGDETDTVCVIGLKGGMVKVVSLGDAISAEFSVKGNSVQDLKIFGNTVAAIGYSSQVVIFDFKTQSVAKKYSPNVNCIATSLAFSSDGKKLAVGYNESNTGVVRILNLGTEISQYAILPAFSASVSSVQFLHEDQYILILDKSSKIKAYEIENTKEVFFGDLSSTGDRISKFYVSADQEKVIIGTLKGALLFFSLQCK